MPARSCRPQFPFVLLGREEKALLLLLSQVICCPDWLHARREGMPSLPRACAIPWGADQHPCWPGYLGMTQRTNLTEAAEKKKSFKHHTVVTGCPRSGLNPVSRGSTHAHDYLQNCWIPSCCRSLKVTHQNVFGLVLEAGNSATLPESLNSYLGVELASIKEGSSWLADL